MLKKLMLLLVICGFTQAAHASIAKDAAASLVGITALTGGLFFTGGLFGALAHSCEALMENNEHRADVSRQKSYNCFKIALAGALVCISSAYALDQLGYNLAAAQ